ncbi:hypothetical protein NEMIN01_1226 [Nematocida minor]|uniref:uncharacterized protein n=1 Tax=Nematocida minor TaxID=1912983 RepID=UPI00221FE368|nr:uncharacterized protein NEMIN01_1226 [Nematocida minor]KAI5190824.1 hypothetical protein NEMIN01_1226 [Nematocida minor]
MSSNEEYLERIEKVLSDPFSVTMAHTTYEKVHKIAQSQGRFYPTGALHKALGLMCSRVSRNTIAIEGLPVDQNENEKACSTHMYITGDTAHIVGMEVSLPLGLKSIAYCIKKGVKISEQLMREVSEIETKSYIVMLSLISIAKAIVQTGQDKDGVFYNKIVDMIGEANSTVKIKAINAALKIGTGSNLIDNTLAALKQDSANIMPNPVWSPGMLALVGIHIYKTKDKKASKKALKIVSNYIGKLSNEKVLNGVLVIFWGMNWSGFSRHLPFLVLMSLFSRSVDIRKSSIGLLMEYLGHNPSDRSLHVIDSIKHHKPDIKMLLKFARVSRKLLVRYSDVLIAEGTPLLIKRAVQLKIYAGEKECQYDSTDIFSKIAAFRFFLKRRNITKLEELISATNPSKLSTLVKIDMELLRQMLKSIKLVGPSSPNSKLAILYTLNKNLFTRQIVKILYIHRQKVADINIRRAMKTPTTLLALAVLKDPILQNIENTGLECPSVSLYAHSPVYAACIYLLAANRAVSHASAKNVLFKSLSCYAVDPTLGDIGSYSRTDALYLLMLPYIDTPLAMSKLSGALVRDTPIGVIASKLTKKRLHLTKEEKSALVGYILKLAVDKSRRLSLLIFSSILPSIKKPPKILRHLLDKYNAALDNLPVEDSILAAGISTLKCLLRKNNREDEMVKREDSAKTSGQTRTQERIGAMLEGIINTLISSDGRLSKKIISGSLEIFSDQLCRDLANSYLKHLLKTASKSSCRIINEIKSKIMI